MKQIIITVIIAAAIGFFLLDDDGPGDGPGVNLLADEEGEVVVDEKQVNKELDAECERMVKEPNCAEARAWCDPKKTEHVGFEVSKADMLKMTNDLYSAGATKVYVADIMEFGGKKTSACLIVQMPSDAGARERVLGVEKRIMEQEGGEGSQDTGQKYLMLTLE